MRRKALHNMHDFIFLQQIMALDGKSLTREAIQYYISERQNIPYKELTNMEIYRALNDILRSGMSREARPMTGQREMRRIIID